MNKKDNLKAIIELEQHLQFQSLLAELSADLVRVSTDTIDQAIQDSLRRIAENLDLDLIALGLLTVDGQDFYSRYQFANPFMKPWLGLSLMSESPLLTNTLLDGQPFIMEDVDALSPEYSHDRESFLHYGIKADLVFPFIVGERLHGGIGFASSRPRRWPDNEVRGLGLIANVYANVLERKRNLQMLQSREEQMRLAAEAADIALWVWNIPLDMIWATDRARAMYGVSSDDELNMRRFLECLHHKDRERIKDVVEKAFKDGRDFREEYRVVHLDGSEYWICATGKCQFDEAGHPESLMGASLNITETRRTKRELERANDELKSALDEICHLKEQIQQENIYLKTEIACHKVAGQIISKSEVMQEVLGYVQQVAPTMASVLIIGETGTGKELLATAIHQASPRKDRAMIRVNCAAIPAALLESELFGREKGAYTGALSKQIGRFELADGSTLFLDEIGELPLNAQVKLLRVLQEKEIERLGNPKPIKIDVRLVAATNRNLFQEVVEGRFREDLYYRLNAFPIQVPPLRMRKQDIPKLVETFTNEFAKAIGKSIQCVSKASMQRLCNYDWPGNIRELRNVIERAVILANAPILSVDTPHNQMTTKTLAKNDLELLADVERAHILKVLEACGWRVSGQNGAAQRLGLKPTTLESRMKKLGVRRPSSL
ncbi:MAG: sigma 54-interacting transcriptional regulator [Methylomicrobium sp.]|nr:sigma 54-interacting transcriptional regulator [Methylomicrobium sp.]